MEAQYQELLLRSRDSLAQELRRSRRICDFREMDGSDLACAILTDRNGAKACDAWAEAYPDEEEEELIHG